jgi:hypothetical protein
MCLAAARRSQHQVFALLDVDDTLLCRVAKSFHDFSGFLKFGSKIKECLTILNVIRVVFVKFCVILRNVINKIQYNENETNFTLCEFCACADNKPLCAVAQGCTAPYAQ